MLRRLFLYCFLLLLPENPLLLTLNKQGQGVAKKTDFTTFKRGENHPFKSSKAFLFFTFFIF